MHMPQTIQTNMVIIGKGDDGCDLRQWNEGNKTFVERYKHFPTRLGYKIGVVVVEEVFA